MMLLPAVILTACADLRFNSPFGAGPDDYYLTDTAPGVAFAPGNASSLSSLGLYPWWSVPPASSSPAGQTFAYYSPNFYPHRFSVGYMGRPGYGHGWYGGYSPWCPPYRLPTYRSPVVADIPTHGSDGTPAPAPYRSLPVYSPEWRRIVEERGYSGTRAGRYGGLYPSSAYRREIYRPGHSSGASSSSAFSSTSRSSRPTSARIGARSGSTVSRRSPALHDQ